MPVSSLCALFHGLPIYLPLDGTYISTISDVLYFVKDYHARCCGCGRSPQEAWISDAPSDVSEGSGSGTDDSDDSSCHATRCERRRHVELDENVSRFAGQYLIFETFAKQADDSAQTTVQAPLLKSADALSRTPEPANIAVKRVAKIDGSNFLQACMPAPFRIPRRHMGGFCSSFDTRGSVWADKTSAIKRLVYLYCPTMLPRILRPPGFGRTTFTTTALYYHDILSAHIADAAFGPANCAPPSEPAHSQYLVLDLDFTLVSVKGAREFKQCFETYLRWETCQFLDTYKNLLRLPFTGSQMKYVMEDAPLPLGYLFDVVKKTGYRIYLIVDNYNSPLIKAYTTECCRVGVIECLIRSLFASFIGAALRTGLIAGGFFLGTSDNDATPNPLSDISFDATYDPGLHDALGFTESEIAELGDLFCRPKGFIERVKAAKQVQRFCPVEEEGPECIMYFGDSDDGGSDVGESHADVEGDDINMVLDDSKDENAMFSPYSMDELHIGDDGGLVDIDDDTDMTLFDEAAETCSSLDTSEDACWDESVSDPFGRDSDPNRYWVYSMMDVLQFLQEEMKMDKSLEAMTGLDDCPRIELSSR
ncbi:hypothetical protein FISHEDRAFT_69827 [Fistulina hepatica ATCC 64428]|uniref:AAA-ATPase-like domain-containing protein n=1 Tax=Fistulina hepatica ATCC 64428 TaxID=1128425 RepID=A0A0D7ANP2_9AGAR|nr:hypothetical protein FISHEDRAFT_69827 [Fistulina hepatica ATCC 64428]